MEDNIDSHVSRSGQVWLSRPSNLAVRTGRENTVKGVPGPVGVAANAKDPVSTFRLFVTSESSRSIMTHTNSKIETVADNYDDENLCTEMDETDLDHHFRSSA